MHTYMYIIPVAYLILWHVVFLEVFVFQGLLGRWSLVRVHVEEEGEHLDSCRAGTDKELSEILLFILWLRLNILPSLGERERRKEREGGRQSQIEREREKDGGREREREREKEVPLTGALSILAMRSGSGVPQICRILLR